MNANNEYNIFGYLQGPPVKPHNSYGCLNFLFDIFMIVLTYGFWIVWIFVREMRKR